MQTLMNFYNFINELKQSNSRNYKLEVLRRYSTDEDVRQYLHFIYNPYIVTGISNKKLHKVVDVEKLTVFGFDTIFKFLNYLKINTTGSDVVVAHCQNVLSEIGNPDLEFLLEGIITKNVQLGIDATSINKCIPDLIPTFNVQLANKYFDKPEYVEGKKFTLTTKIDGGRIIAIKKNGEITFYTRAGQKYEGLVDLEQEMAEKLPDNICFDGEITLLNPGNMESKEQYKATMKIVRKDGEKHGVKMRVFDMMPADDFLNQNSTHVYEFRRAALETLFSVVSCNYFTLLDNLYTGTDTNEIQRILNEQIANGEEGIMINICDAYYEFKRTNSLLKVKKMKDIDLRIVGYEEGSNSNKGKLGAFIVDYKGNQVKVGSGFSKELREEIWKNPDEYIGLMIAVQYFEETTNQNGGTSLRFPVFLDFRYDLA